MDRQDTQNVDTPIPDAPERPAEQAAFENVSALGYEEYLQCYKKIWFHSTRMKIWLVTIALCLAGFFLQWEMVLASPMSLFLFVAVVGLLLLAVLLYAPRKQAKLTAGRIKETYGQIPEVRASFFQDRIVFHNTASNGDISLRYDNISDCLETRDVILLVTKQKQFHSLVKAGFSGTDEAGFRAFIREKASNAKYYWKKD